MVSPVCAITDSVPDRGQAATTCSVVRVSTFSMLSDDLRCYPLFENTERQCAAVLLSKAKG